MEGTETLCPHATILNHRWVSGTHSWLLSLKPDQWMHLSPIYTRVHGEWLRYANSTSQFHWRFLLVRDDWAFQVNPLCRHDITSPFPPSGNEGYVRNRDVFCTQYLKNLQMQWKYFYSVSASNKNKSIGIGQGHRFAFDIGGDINPTPPPPPKVFIYSLWSGPLLAKWVP